MFTGIVEETGVVDRIRPGADSIELVLRAPSWARSLRTGDSLAVNGCCLTVVRQGPAGTRRRLYFDLLRETWERTNLKAVQAGALVNLERSLRADGRIDGHFVTGHIDGTGKILRWERSGKDRVLEVKVPRSLARHIVVKGSIALDGISLTVASVRRDAFRVWIIPHTYKVTALRERKVGDELNVETDILGKYVEKFVSRP